MSTVAECPSPAACRAHWAHRGSCAAVLVRPKKQLQLAASFLVPAGGFLALLPPLRFAFAEGRLPGARVRWAGRVVGKQARTGPDWTGHGPRSLATRPFPPNADPVVTCSQCTGPDSRLRGSAVTCSPAVANGASTPVFCPLSTQAYLSYLNPYHPKRRSNLPYRFSLYRYYWDNDSISDLWCSSVQFCLVPWPPLPKLREPPVSACCGAARDSQVHRPSGACAVQLAPRMPACPSLPTPPLPAVDPELMRSGYPAPPH